MKRFVLLLAFLPAATGAQPVPLPAAAGDCAECPELALVPPGVFQLGTAPDARERDPATGESPPLRVAISRPFLAARREVTVGEFRRYVEETGNEPAPGCRVWLGGQWVLERDRGWRDPGFVLPPRDDDPVVCVSWDDAQAYAEWLSGKSGKRYRLPSETEWEYLARGGTSFARYWGEHDSHEAAPMSLACEHANTYDVAARELLRMPWPNAHCSDGHPALAPAGSYRANAFGMHDILGNAREWTQDCYTASHRGRPADARAWTWQGGCDRRVVRGGSWASRPFDARAAARGAEERGLRQSDLGFRLVRDAD